MVEYLFYHHYRRYPYRNIICADHFKHGRPLFSDAQLLFRLPLHNNLIRRNMVKMIQRLERHIPAQDVPIEPVRQRRADLVAHVPTRRHGKDVIQLFERALLGLGHPQEYHHQRRHVEPSVEPEGARRSHGREHARERDGQHGRPAETGGHGPGHADLAVRQREDFGGVGEGHGAFARRVKGREEVDEQRDAGELFGGVVGQQEAQAGREQGPGHVGEGEEEQRAAAVGVNGKDCGERKREVHQTKPPGCPVGGLGGGARVGEDGGRVEADDVDAAHLLGDHDDEGGEGCAADTRDGEELDGASDVVARADDFVLDLDLSVDVVEVAGGLEFSVAQTQQRLVCLAHLAISDVPAGRLRAEVYADKKRNGGDEGRAELQSPRDVARVHHCQVCTAAEEDSKGSPQLPAHDEAAADSRWGVLGAEDGDGGSFQAHADSEQDASDEELGPGLGDSAADGREDTEDGGDEDGATPGEETVQWVRAPAADDSGANIRGTIYIYIYIQLDPRHSSTKEEDTHELTTPTSHSLREAFGPDSGIPRASGNDKLAPLDPS
jgi:hypothetical protein